MKRLILSIVGLVFIAPIAIAADTFHTAVKEKITHAVEAVLPSTDVTGITIAAGKNGDVFYAAGFGLRDVETGALVETTTKMRAGSVSKVYTTALIGKLIEAGKLNLDAPVQTYVPSFPKKRWPITVRQMAGHMSGIRHYRGSEFASTRHYATMPEGLVIFARDPLEFKPGTRTSYSSYAWNLISAALEGTGKTPFLDMMHEQVFKPLGMQDTVAEDVTKPLSNMASFHENRRGSTVIAAFVDNSYKWAGGGFVGTAADMARFGLAHTEPGFLKAETLALLQTEQKTEAGEEVGFGIGWMTAGAMKRRLLRDEQNALIATFSDQLMWHSGGSMGAVALLLVDPSHNSAVALMANNSASFSTLLTLGLKTLGWLQTS